MDMMHLKYFMEEEREREREREDEQMDEKKKGRLISVNCFLLQLNHLA